MHPPRKSRAGGSGKHHYRDVPWPTALVLLGSHTLAPGAVGVAYPCSYQVFDSWIRRQTNPEEEIPAASGGDDNEEDDTS